MKWDEVKDFLCAYVNFENIDFEITHKDSESYPHGVLVNLFHLKSTYRTPEAQALYEEYQAYQEELKQLKQKYGME